METDIFTKVDHYIAGLVAHEGPHLTGATALIRAAGLPDQSISPVQGKLLQVFARACQAKRILEVGTFGSYSTIWLAEALPKQGRLITIESDEIHAEVALENIQRAGLQERVTLKRGRAMDVLNTMIETGEAAFDLIFIDADKPPYTEYFQAALRLSRKGSIIICDNVIRNGAVLNEASQDEKVKGVQRLNAFLKDCKEVTATILQTVGVKEYDGMVIAVVN